MSKLAVSTFTFTLLATWSPTSTAGDLAYHSLVSSVANTGGNEKNFAVKVTGGTGPCVGHWIIFPELDAADVRAHHRAYAAALLAFSNGIQVRIHSYVNNACDRAAYIELIK